MKETPAAIPGRDLCGTQALPGLQDMGTADGEALFFEYVEN